MHRSATGVKTGAHKIAFEIFCLRFAYNFRDPRFLGQQCATGIRLAKNGPEECQIQYFLLIFSVFWPPFSGYSAPCGFTSGHEREPHYASKSFTEVVFKVNRSRVIRHSLTFLFGNFGRASGMQGQAARPSAAAGGRRAPSSSQ